MSIYTPALVSKIKALSVDGAPITFAQAQAFADAEGLKVRSVVAKIRTIAGLKYEPKPTKVTKTGAPVVKKESLVKSIEVALGVSVPTLDKVSKEGLESLLRGVASIAERG